MTASGVLKVCRKESTNDILMKLTRFMQLYESYHLTEILGVTCRTLLGVSQKCYKNWPQQGFLVIIFTLL